MEPQAAQDLVDHAPLVVQGESNQPQRIGGGRRDRGPVSASLSVPSNSSVKMPMVEWSQYRRLADLPIEAMRPRAVGSPTPCSTWGPTWSPTSSPTLPAGA